MIQSVIISTLLQDYFCTTFNARSYETRLIPLTGITPMWTFRINM